MVKTIFDLIEENGGSLKIAYEVGVHQYTVVRWRKHGVPKKYFPYFEKRGIPSATIVRLNQKVSAQKL